MSGMGGTMDDQTQELDLLADGELGDDRRRELLSRLDEQPDGWRRCAMAFLEAQDWRREMPRAAREPTFVPIDDRTESTEDEAAAPETIVRRPPLGWLGTM